MLKDSRFTEIDEEFICENCGKKVPKLGYSCRNHCPYCLHSKHVDKNPGDRAEECHGDLEPVSMEIDGKKGYVIVFRCKKCGAIRRNKAAKDDNMVNLQIVTDESCNYKFYENLGCKKIYETVIKNKESNKLGNAYQEKAFIYEKKL